MPITFTAKIVRPKVYMTVASPVTLTFIQSHKCVSNVTIYFLTCNISENINLSCYIHTWHGGRLMHGIYAHARFDDLELDLEIENVCKACATCFSIKSNPRPASAGRLSIIRHYDYFFFIATTYSTVKPREV